MGRRAESSVIIALGTTVISTVSGVLAAWASFERFTFPLKSVVYLVIVAVHTGGSAPGPFFIASSPPYLVTAWAMLLVFMLMEATFRTVDHRIVEASYDLGGRPVQTFFEIVLPSVSTGIISSALFAFVISLNEFVMALFLTTRDTQTLPVLMWLSLRSAGTPRSSRSPRSCSPVRSSSVWR